MPDALDAIDFLANSENRVRVLETLASDPQSRADLHERTGIHKVTLGRILGDLQEHRWIRRSGEEFEVTTFGEQVIEQFTVLMEVMECGQRLDELIEWLPSEVVSFDLRCLEEATIVRRDRHDIAVLERELVESYASAESIRVLSYQVSPTILDPFRELAVEKGGTVEAVVTPALLETLAAHSEMRQSSVEIVDSEKASVFVSDEIPVQVAILDDTAVVLVLADADDTLQAVLRTDDSTVREWATELFARTRRDADPVTRERLLL